MKFVHVSDLHLGKRLHETSLIEDQQAILNQILNIIDSENPSGVFIAGDIYDKSSPSAEAVALFDFFISELAKRRLHVFIISGNHDSAERIAFGSKILDATGIHLSPVYNGEILPTKLTDKYGEIDVYMLPFVKPSHVRRFYEDENIESYTDAIKVAIEKMNLNSNNRNVLITHQFVTGATRSESEESVGGTDNVDASVFANFDYVALGHLHGPQNCGDIKIRYSGTPLKYSFAEANDTKSVTVIELKEKGTNLDVKTVELKPIRDMKKIRGEFNDLINIADRTEDYVQITLTDEEDIPNAMSRLQNVYKNALELRYDNTRTRTNMEILSAEDVENKSAFELFSDFFKERNNAEMNEKQSEYVKSLIEKIEGGQS
ncbi:MAG: exonuclease SbcCD subunit D [Clostridiales bacterium]|nr:exonuclease SbcCD subunit D [Clostridiales bacterium]